MKSRRRRLSATVACTSTPANSVSSGVETTSRVPSAVAPTNTSPWREGAGRHLSAEDVGCREVGERPLLPSISEQKVAPSIERNGSAVENERRRVDVGAAEGDRSRAGRAHDRGQREAWIHAAVILDQERRAPQDAVGVGCGVEEAGRARRLRQLGKTADDAGRVEERRLAAAARLDQRGAERVQHARRRLRLLAVERQRIADHDSAGAKRVRERCVRRLAGLGSRSDPAPQKRRRGRRPPRRDRGCGR